MQADIALNMICQGERYRPVDEAKVREIADSMAIQGLLQPIVVRPCMCEGHDVLRHFRLIVGAHRVQAAELLQWDSIAASVFSDDLSEEMAQLAELQENSARNELTGAQRKQYVAEIGRISARIDDFRESANRQNKWLIELAKTAGISERTLLDWWHTFCGVRGISLRPQQKEAISLRQPFLDWLDAQRQEAEAEKERKAKEARQKRQEADCAREVRVLEDLIDTYSFDVVEQDVWNVVCAHYEPRNV